MEGNYQNFLVHGHEMQGWYRSTQDHFPFKEYFADAPGVLFRGNLYEQDMEAARGCWRHLRTMFQELEECRAFELLKVLNSFCVVLCFHNVMVSTVARAGSRWP